MTSGSQEMELTEAPESECLRSGAGNVVTVSKLRRGLSAAVVINLESGQLDDHSLLSTLRRTGICRLFTIPWEEQNSCTLDTAIGPRVAVVLEGTVGRHPAVAWVQWNRVMCMGPKPLTVKRTQVQ